MLFHKMNYLNVRVPRSLINLAGLPPTILKASTSRVTTEPAATTAPSPIVTPLSIMALEPIHTLSCIVMGASRLEKYGSSGS